MPCARMHREYFSACARAAACCAALSVPRGGSSGLQALVAALNCGDLGSRPVPGPPFSFSPPWRHQPADQQGYTGEAARRSAGLPAARADRAVIVWMHGSSSGWVRRGRGRRPQHEPRVRGALGSSAASRDMTATCGAIRAVPHRPADRTGIGLQTDPASAWRRMASRPGRAYAGAAMNPRLASLLRRPAVLDVGAAALLAALALVIAWRLTFPPARADRILVFGSVGAWRWHVTVWWAASVVALAALPLRHRFPVIAFGLTLAMATVHSLVLVLGPSPVDFAVAITAYTLASARPRRTSVGVLSVGGALAVMTYEAVLAAIAGGPGQQTRSWANDWLGKPGNAVVPALLALVVVAAWFA